MSHAELKSAIDRSSDRVTDFDATSASRRA